MEGGKEEGDVGWGVVVALPEPAEGAARGFGQCHRDKSRDDS